MPLRAVHSHSTERTNVIAAHFHSTGAESIRCGEGQQRLDRLFEIVATPDR